MTDYTTEPESIKSPSAPSAPPLSPPETATYPSLTLEPKGSYGVVQQILYKDNVVVAPKGRLTSSYTGKKHKEKPISDGVYQVFVTGVRPSSSIEEGEPSELSELSDEDDEGDEEACYYSPVKVCPSSRGQDSFPPLQVQQSYQQQEYQYPPPAYPPQYPPAAAANGAQQQNCEPTEEGYYREVVCKIPPPQKDECCKQPPRIFIGINRPPKIKKCHPGPPAKVVYVPMSCHKCRPDKCGHGRCGYGGCGGGPGCGSGPGCGGGPDCRRDEEKKKKKIVISDVRDKIQEFKELAMEFSERNIRIPEQFLNAQEKKKKEQQRSSCSSCESCGGGPCRRCGHPPPPKKTRKRDHKAPCPTCGAMGRKPPCHRPPHHCSQRPHMGPCCSSCHKCCPKESKKQCTVQ